MFFGMIADSQFRCRSSTGLQDLRAISEVLPSADPGMDNSARYIRHLGLSTPGSAFPDYPGQPDYLPSGMMWPPPSHFVGTTTREPLFQSSESSSEGVKR